MKLLRSYSYKSSQGPHLNLNEDDVDINLSKKLFAIYDGFGGSGAGDIAVKLIKKTVSESFGRISGDPDATLPFFYSNKYLAEANALVNAMYAAQKEVLTLNKDKGLSQKGGASGVLVTICGDMITFVGTGNCVVYLYKKGAIELVYRPNSYSYSCNDISLNHLTSSPLGGFGLFEDIDFNVMELKTQKDDLYILLTDGAYAHSTMKDIRSIVERSELHDSQKIEEIFSLSNERGNLDNQSGMLLRF